ncbi:hypothetical protein [Hymenobacter sp. UYAg731]
MQLLPGTAARAADTARALALLTPAPASLRRRSDRANWLLWLLLPLLALAGLTHCATPRAASEAHSVRSEKAHPAHARYEWRNGDDD